MTKQTIKNDVDSFFHTQKAVEIQVFNLDKKIREELYSDETHTPSVSFADAWDSNYAEVRIEYNNCKTLSDDMIKQIMDSIKEVFSECNTTLSKVKNLNEVPFHPKYKGETRGELIFTVYPCKED